MTSIHPLCITSLSLNIYPSIHHNQYLIPSPLGKLRRLNLLQRMLRVTIQLTLLLRIGRLLRELRRRTLRRGPDLAAGGGILLLDAGLTLRGRGLAA